MKRELVIVLDFGGQYNQLVARRVRECNVYCAIYSYRIDIEKIKAMNPKGIILTGGPNSCYLEDSPTYSKELFELGIPVLGLCYGAQLMMHVLGGKVEKADVREYGKTEVLIDTKNSRVFQDVSEKTICWMSHLIIFPGSRRDLRSQPTRQTVRWLRRKMQTRNCMRSSFIRRCFTPQREPRCFIILCAVSATAPETGGWIPLWKVRSRRSGKRWATEKSSWPCPAAWILPWLQVFCPKPSADS